MIRYSFFHKDQEVKPRTGFWASEIQGYCAKVLNLLERLDGTAGTRQACVEEFISYCKTSNKFNLAVEDNYQCADDAHAIMLFTSPRIDGQPIRLKDNEFKPDLSMW